MTKPLVRYMERVKRIGRYFAGKPRAKCWFRRQRCGELEAYSDADWGGESQGVDQEMASGGAVSAESELCAAVKTASEGLGIQSVAKDLGLSCGLNLHLDASATMCLVNRRGLGKAKHVDMQNLWIQEGFQFWPVHHEEIWHERESRRPDDETAGKAEDRTTDELHRSRVHKD